jgi:hypothetical protein
MLHNVVINQNDVLAAGAEQKLTDERACAATA